MIFDMRDFGVILLKLAEKFNQKIYNIPATSVISILIEIYVIYQCNTKT